VVTSPRPDNVRQLRPARTRSVGIAKPSAPPSGGYTELGVTLTAPFSSSGELAPWVNEQEGYVAVKDLVRMRRESGQARALLRLIILPIISSLNEAQWIGPDGEDSGDEVEFMNNVFTLPPQAGGMSVTFHKFMRQLLLAIFDGYSAFEKVWHVPDIGPLAGKITLKKMAYRSPTTLSFLVDDNGGFDGLHQVTSIGHKSVDVRIPREKCFYFAANEEENPFYGVSYFNAAYFHWDKTQKLAYLSHIAAQMQATGGRVGHMPPNATKNQVLAFQKTLKEFGFKSAASLPDGFSIDFPKIGGTFNYLELSRSVLATFLDKIERQVLIDNSTQAADDLFVLSIESLMDEIAAAISHYVCPQLIDWNFGTGVYPVLKFGEVADSTRDILAEVFKSIAVAATVNATPEFLFEAERKLSARLGLDIDYAEVKSRMETERLIEAEQAAMTRDQLAGQPTVGLQGGVANGNPASQGEPPLPPGSQAAEDQTTAASRTTGTTLDLDLIARMARDLDGAGDGPAAGPGS
jgi:hypothetical protein